MAQPLRQNSLCNYAGEVVPADRPGTTIMVLREPAGVVFSISPWNVSDLCSCSEKKQSFRANEITITIGTCQSVRPSSSHPIDMWE